MLKRFLFLLLFVVTVTSSCSEKELVDKPEIETPDPIPDPEPEPEPIPDPEPTPDPEPEPEIPSFYPIDFDYITLNHSGYSQGVDFSDVSYIKKGGTVIPTYFSDVNNRTLGLEPRSAVQVADKLLITMGSRSQSKIEVVEPNTFKVVRTIDFKDSILALDTEQLNGNSVLVVGIENQNIENPFNVIIGDIGAEQFVKTKFNIGFSPAQATKVGDKIFVGGEMTSSKIGVLDIDNITLAGLRVIENSSALFSLLSDFLLDKNGMLWVTLQNSDGGAMLCRINPNTETVDLSLDIPNTSIYGSSSVGAAICPDGKYVYIRAYKAFYRINVDSPNEEVFFDPMFNHYQRGGNINDLKVIKNGNLIFISENITLGKPGQIFEYKENNEDGSWSKLVENGVLIGEKATVIYVGKYEK